MHRGEARHMPLAHSMLSSPYMKTRSRVVLATLLWSSAALAEQAATTSPDFVAASPKRHIDRSLVASPDGDQRIDPDSVVAFQLDRSQLTDAGYTQVDTAAQWLKQHPRHLLVLEGHTDATGDAAYNQDLATRRMATVRQRLMQHGIPGDRVMLITFGEREAMDAEDPLHGADRRVVMYATELSPRAVAAVVERTRPAIVATWVERGALMQLTHDLQVPEKTVPAPQVSSRR